MNRLTTRASAAVAAVLLAVLTSLATSLAPATADSGPGSGDGSGHGSGHGDDHGNGGGHGHGNNHLASIPLPNDFHPEDITNGPHHTFYVGSLATGGIWQGNYRSGTGSLFAAASPNHGPTTGLYLQKRHGHDWLWAAGGPTGQARVYDASTGAIIKTWELQAAGAGFISDVITTRYRAYYTDAFTQHLFVIDLTKPDMPVTTIPLAGDNLAYQGNGAFNLNGLAYFKGWLVSVQTATGQLWAIDPTTGTTKQIPVTDKRTKAAVTVPGGDGIAQRGNKLYVAQNIPNMIATLKLDSHLDGARLIAQVGKDKAPGLDVPSSVEEDRGNLWALNARFTTPTPANGGETFSIVKVDKH